MPGRPDDPDAPTGAGTRAARTPAHPDPGGAPTFDLQSHSTYSDGALSPTEVVQRGAAAGCRTLALSDHDSVSGVAEALEAGRAAGITVVPAVELSTTDPDHDDLHLLGYGIDHTDRRLLETLERFRDDRANRATRMADALEELGFVLDRVPLRERRRAGGSVGRPHLAQAVFDRPENAERLWREGIDSEPSQVLVAYLTPGAPAYRGRTEPTVAEAIDVVHAAGGRAVWAHPFWDVTRPDIVRRTVARFVGLGLDGVEAFYATHDRSQTRLLVEEAERHGLLTTGSADFHGPGHAHFHAFRAFRTYGYEPNLGPIGA